MSSQLFHSITHTLQPEAEHSFNYLRQFFHDEILRYGHFKVQ